MFSHLSRVSIETTSLRKSFCACLSSLPTSPSFLRKFSTSVRCSADRMKRWSLSFLCCWSSCNRRCVSLRLCCNSTIFAWPRAWAWASIFFTSVNGRLNVARLRTPIRLLSPAICSTMFWARFRFAFIWLIISPKMLWVRRMENSSEMKSESPNSTTAVSFLDSFNDSSARAKVFVLPASVLSWGLPSGNAVLNLPVRRIASL